MSNSCSHLTLADSGGPLNLKIFCRYVRNIMFLNFCICAKRRYIAVVTQTEQKHTSMTFVWFPDHVLWYSVS